MVKFPFKPNRGFLVIEVSRASLKIAYFMRSASGLELLDYSLERLDSGQDSLGQITGSIRSFLKNKSLPVKEAVLSIADTDSVVIKYCLLPALKRREILNAAKWQLKDEVPFDLDHAYCDWQVVKEFKDEEGAQQQGIIFAFVRKEEAEKYLSCLGQCGLRASSLVTSVFNYAAILKDTAQDKHFNSEIVLDLEYVDSILSLYIGKRLYFTRYLPVSVDTITRSLIGTLVSDRGKVELTLREAEEIRDNTGIPQDETVFIKDNLQASQIIALIRPVLEILARETKHSITYFVSHLQEPAPQVIYIVGLGANLKNLDIYLEKELGFSVTRLSLPGIVETNRIDPVRLAKDQGQLLSCVGAALADSYKINLSPASRGFTVNWIKFGWARRLIPLFSVAGVFILSFMFISLLMFPVYSFRLEKAKNYFKDKKQLFSLFEKAGKDKELVFEVSLQRVPADAVLNLISRNIPDGLILNELEFNQHSGELILRGEGRKASDAEVFIGKLMASGFFSDIKRFGPSPTKEGFKIKCRLIY